MRSPSNQIQSASQRDRGRVGTMDRSGQGPGCSEARGDIIFLSESGGGTWFVGK